METQITSGFEHLMKENTRLETENAILRELIKNYKMLNDNQIDALKTKVVDMGLSSRLTNIFLSAEINTLGDIVKCTKRDLFKYRTFGIVLLNETEKMLKRYNLSLAKEKTFVTQKI